jgi:uncharacterized protein HemY
MLRALLFFLKVAVLVGIAWFLIERQPGRITLDWWGYRIETSIGVLFLAALVLAVLAALLYRIWRGVWQAPGDIGRWRGRSRQRRGYRALTQGMVAVAAGDPDEAQRLARKADTLLNEPPLTLLLSAQAAQLNGDDQAAKRYFTAMLERDETRFLGLRGLINQALREGDEETALTHVRAAYALRPRTPWVLTTLADLSERAGDYDTAVKTVGEAAKAKALPAPEATRKRAVLALERAVRSQQDADRSLTVKLAREAHKLAPDLVPATLLHAELLVASGPAARLPRGAPGERCHGAADRHRQAGPGRARPRREPARPGRGRARRRALGRGAAPPRRGRRTGADGKGLPPHGAARGLRAQGPGQGPCVAPERGRGAARPGLGLRQLRRRGGRLERPLRRLPRVRHPRLASPAPGSRRADRRPRSRDPAGWFRRRQRRARDHGTRPAGPPARAPARAVSRNR